MPELEKRDWPKLCAGSNGQMMLVPGKFTKSFQEIEKARKEFNEFLNTVAEKEIKLNFRTQEVFFALRAYLAENGHKDIWSKDLGLNTDALVDDAFVVNINEQRR